MYIAIIIIIWCKFYISVLHENGRLNLKIMHGILVS